MKRMVSVSVTGVLVVCLGLGCGDDDSAGANNNNGNQAGLDAGVDAFVQQDAEVVDDPLCPTGQQCLEVTTAGRLGCLTGGEPPPTADRDCLQDGCPGNARCTYTDEAQTETACLENCGGCLPGTTCTEIVDGYLGCLDNGAFPSGVQTGCYDGAPCEGNTTCWYYSNTDPIQSFCIQNCSSCRPGTCPTGQVCGASGVCEDEPCTPGSCETGEICVVSEGVCALDPGPGPGPGPGPSCTNLPPRDCTAGATACAELIQFDPTNNPADANYDPLLGYIDCPENGETWANQYRSWLRRDVVMAIQHAAALTACKSVGWTAGNGGPVGLIDMSEADGSIPGTSIGSPGHPTGTHTNGYQIDIAYWQTNTSNNEARPVCDHMAGGSDAYHCVDHPYLLDPWRTALFIGTMMEHDGLRAVGVDGKVGPVLEVALDTLCAENWLSGPACAASHPLWYEVVDEGMGWFQFHHHHMHVDVSFITSPKAAERPAARCLLLGCETGPLAEFLAGYGLTLPPTALARQAD
jgi:hypothetical protein